MFREIDASRYADCPFDARARLGLLICENNAMTVGWGLFGILWKQPTVALFIRPSRYTDTLLMRARRATLCFLDSEHADALSLCGKISGRDFLGGSGADAAGAEGEKENRAGSKLLRAGLTPIRLTPGGEGAACVGGIEAGNGGTGGAGAGDGGTGGIGAGVAPRGVVGAGSGDGEEYAAPAPWFPSVAEATAAFCLETSYAAPLAPDRLCDSLTRRFYPNGDYHKLCLCAVRAVFLRA